MKKAVALAIIIIAMITPVLQAQKLGEKKNFIQIYQETLELNKDRFSDLNLIQINDTVLLAAKEVGGTTYFMIADSVSKDGINDCIYRITTRYVANTIKTAPLTPVIEEVEIIEDTDEAESSYWPFLFIIIFLFVVLIGLFLFWATKSNQESERNPDNHPPVITGGLNEDMATALSQIRNSDSNPDAIIGLQKIIYNRESGVKRWLVRMSFGDQIQRKAYILPGEFCHKTLRQREDGSTYEGLHRSTCGNPTHVIVHDTITGITLDHNGKIISPEGWNQLIIQDYMVPGEATVTEEALAELPANQQAVTPPALQTNEPKLMAEGEFTAKVIKAGGKNVSEMNISMKDTGMEVQVTFK